MGVLPLLDRRADACNQLVQSDITLLPAPQNPALHPHTCRHWSAGLEFYRCLVERSRNG